MADNVCRKCSEPVLPIAETCPHCGADNPTDDFIGRTIRGNIRIDRLIGQGGMGNVYQGVEVHLERPVAVKVLNNVSLTSERTISYFTREARVLSRLRHPNIVSVMDFGREEDGTFYLVLEYIPGQTLEDLIVNRVKLSIQRCLRILVQILNALAEAHRHHVIHRDLKPSNILLEKIAGQEDFVKVLDFGVAKLLETEGQKSVPKLTLAGTVVGTPHYMSPEQAQGLDLDGRSDVYAAGTVLYEMLTGQTPFEDENPVSVVVKRVIEDAPPPSSLRADLPHVIDELCGKALAREPDDRFDGVAAFRTEAEHLLNTYFQSGQTLAVEEPAAEPESEEDTPAAVIAIRPYIIPNAATGQTTEAKRYASVWESVHELVSDEKDLWFRAPSGKTGYVVLDGRRALNRAVQTALDLKAATSRRFPFARFHFGVDLGDVALPTDDDIMSPPTGEAVDGATDLARRALAGQIITRPSHTHRLTGTFDVEAFGDAVEVLGLPSMPGGPTTRSTSGNRKVLASDVIAAQVGLVGRRSERNRFDQILHAIASGENAGAPIVLSGPTGVGKSTLIKYVERQANEMGLPALVSYAAYELVDRPFRPLLDLCLKASGVQARQDTSLSTGSFTTEDMRSGLTLLGLSDTDTAILANQFDTGQDDSSFFTSGVMTHPQLAADLRDYPAQERRRLFTSSMRALLRMLTAAGGSVLIIEDIHRADAGTLACMPALAHLVRQLPILMVVTTDSNDIIGLEDFDLVSLRGITGTERSEFWNGLVEIAQLEHKSTTPMASQGVPAGEPPPTVRPVLSASRGLPLYLAAWQRAPLNRDPPGSVVELLALQIAELPGRLRRMLLVTSVLGEYFELPLLRQLFPKAQNLRAVLEHASQLGLLERCLGHDQLWRFSNPLIHSAVYRSISRADRMRYHAMVATNLNQLEADAGTRPLLLDAIHNCRGRAPSAAFVAEELADQFAAAGGPAAAGEWYFAALDAVKRAVKNGQEIERGRISELSLKAAEVALATGDIQRASDLIRLVQPVHDHHVVARGSLAVRIALANDDPAAAQQMVTHTLTAIRTPHPGVARIHMLHARLLMTSQPREAITALRLAAQVADAQPPQAQRTEFGSLGWRCRVQLARLAITHGDLETASNALQEALTIVARSQQPFGYIPVLSVYADVCDTSGRLTEFLEIVARITNTNSLGLRLTDEVVLDRLTGWTLARLQRHDEASTALERALARALELGWPGEASRIRAIQRGEWRQNAETSSFDWPVQGG